MKFSLTFLFTLSLAVATLTVGASAHARLIDRTEALVNGDVVLNSDLSAFKKNYPLRREVDPFINLTQFRADSNKDVLEYLVQEKLVLQKSSADESEIEAEINNVQSNNKIGREQLKEVLKSQGVNFEDYRRLMAVSVSKRKLIERDLRPLAAVSDEDVKNYYYTESSNTQRLKEQKLVLSYSLQQLILPNSGLAEEASKRIQAGEDFDAVAADLAGKGAETSKLTSISEENLNSKMRDAVKSLKVGESTKPVSAGSGYVILKVTDIGAPKDPVFEKEKERIRNVLFQKALINQLKIWTERERATSYVQISSN